MKLYVEKDYEKLSKVAANIVREEIEKNPNIVLGLATGSTPEGMYRELIKMHKGEGLDFSKVTTFNLDEYVGIDEGHPNSYHYFMKEMLFNHINIDFKNTFIPDGKTKDPEKYCKKYDELIEKKGGIDLQILGIGENGHIAFNEPDETLNLGTSIVNLTQSTIEANSRFFDSIDEVPKTAITMGIGTILKAKKIVLLANGKKKAKVIKELLKGEKISTKLPASMLLLHPNVTIIIDQEAYNG
ncbi:Glucosamine-6-phosphate deaminase [[Clostridium] ultunense Esp]|uniref:Glucosamine-6-phosphate deaminase n=1 Tax=[Clostridium] ultunense Esp TaxID=1288971 RepID=M1Z4Z7_9FIRM|nr:glucosamine-6-phosphate deaminase [Schnuerera ultunensis]CCQ93096.1 Glucosamine-6-phosphate deaminase [[Clostridium] ultunense Esp]SHD77881.1 N-acetylglucosamine-6-phosphate isomerase [[Clostridium] ultunense Esp]